MNKNKFNLKCQELKNYEEEFLNNVRNHFVAANEKLSSIGLIIDVELMFWNVVTRPPEYSFDRIEFSVGYMCFVGIQIRKITDPCRDLDLDAISFEEPITRIGRSLFAGFLKFEKFPEKYIKEFIESVDTYINRVFNEGYENVKNEIKQEWSCSGGTNGSA